MSRGPYPLLLMLAMSLPSTVRALGLGDIHVDSALNEPLSAQIDLIGATPQELLDLRAAIANKDMFQRYNADRPAFLNSATLKVGRDAQGRPVLTVHSMDAFTDPLVSLLVDLRWPHGEVVREYSLLLDPPGFNSHPDGMLAAAPAIAAPAIGAPAIAAPAIAAPANIAAPARLASGHYRVADRDTLRGIARRAGAASEPEAQRVMIAIFRANPHAFAGNINRLHRGADLALPSGEVVAAIASADARREVHAHMSAWRLNGHPGAPARDLTAATAPPAPSKAAAAATTPAPAAAPPTDVLKGRVQTLEQSLDDMKKILASEDAKMLGLQKQVTRAESADSAGASRAMATTAASLVPAAAAAEAEAAAAAAPAHEAAQALDAGTSLAGRVGPFAALAGILIAGFALLRYRQLEKLARPMQLTEAELSNTVVLDETQVDAHALVRETTIPAAASAAPAPRTAPRTAPAANPAESDVPTFPRMPAKRPSGETTTTLSIDTLGMEALALDAADLDPYGIDTAATAKLPVVRSSHQSITVDAKSLAADDLDYNLLDLGATGEHVQMPSGLHDHVIVGESRTNIVEVLKGAIDRDPQRRDLRLKLLEVYYSAAASNQRAFLEVATALSQEREHLTRDEWDKVARMGREIAAGDGLFTTRNDGDELAVA